MLSVPFHPLPVAPEVLAASVFVTGMLFGIAVALTVRWGAKTARTTRAVAEATGQLVVLRAVVGGPCTPICVPKPLAALLTSTPVAGAVLPPWRADVGGAIEALCERVVSSPSQSATLDFDADDRRLRLVGARVGDGAQLLISLAEAGVDVARMNRLEVASLLAAGVAHDLKNVLHTVHMHAELGQDLAMVASVHEHFERIQVGSMRASELMSLMQRQLRGEGSTSAQRVPTSLAAIVEEVVALLRPTLPRGIDVALDLDADAIVLAEPVHLHQIVLNLVINAGQAVKLRPRPRITIDVARDDEGRTITLVVTDNGPGLPSAMRERLFEPYVTTRKEQGGTGLGLSVVRALSVDALGGAIEAGNDSDGGARFVVRLPAVASAPLPPRRQRPRTGEHALIGAES